MSYLYEKPGPWVQPEEPEKPHTKRVYGWVLLLVFSLAVLLFLLVMMLPQLTGTHWTNIDNYAFVDGQLLRYNQAEALLYKQNAAYLDRDILYPGTKIDGTDLGGRTIEQADTLISRRSNSQTKDFSVTVNIGNYSRTLSPENISVTQDSSTAQRKAYALVRTEIWDEADHTQTPFARRCAEAAALAANPHNFDVEVRYDEADIRAAAHSICNYVNREPVDSQIMSFDFNKRTFAFTESHAGVHVDEDLLTAQMAEAVAKWERGVTLNYTPEIIEPEVNKESLEKGFSLIAAYTTSTTSDSDRNTNIRLACEAINGTALMPGETFSFNSATGERTTAKGYRSAGAIQAGQSIEEVGGGICQVSSTLFNAVARADLQILSRSPHAWPSTYVTIGQDATVNWPNLDFKFKNNKMTPVFIITYYKNKKVSAEIWGMTLGEGIKIDLESKTTAVTAPSSEIVYNYNASLPYGTEKTTVKARNGYTVETYKIWYQNGKEIKREKMYTSTYKPYQQVVEYNHY